MADMVISPSLPTVKGSDFTARNEAGRLLNSVRSIGTLGGATIDNEENYLIKKLFGRPRSASGISEMWIGTLVAGIVIVIVIVAVR